MFVSVSAFAQGEVDFSNIGAPSILDPSGAPAGGAYDAALYYAPDGVTDEGMFMQLGAKATLLAGGLVFGGTRTTPSTTAPGGDAEFQVRAWLNTFASYEEALAAPGGEVGRSVIMGLKTGNPGALPVGDFPTSLIGSIDGFQITVVPEPSVVALGLLGAGALLLLRRRK